MACGQAFVKPRPRLTEAVQDKIQDEVRRLPGQRGLREGQRVLHRGVQQMKFLFCVRESDGVVDVEGVDACAGSHLNTFNRLL